MGSLLEGGVLFLSDGGLDFVERLLHKLAILHVEDPVCVALNIRVVSHHHASGGSVLAFALRAHAVDVQDQVHDRH